jgi:hypothetical protein
MTLIAAVQQLAASGASFCGGLLLAGKTGMQNFAMIGVIVAVSMLISIGLCFLFRPVNDPALAA